MSLPALFCDRDGTIIVDQHYPRDASAVRLLPGASAALRSAAEQGFLLVLVSNQSGVARGLVLRSEAQQVHEACVAQLAAEGVQIRASYYCFHGPEDGCACRKPLPGMLLQAAAEHDIDMGASWMIGDKPSDVEAGRAAGLRTIAFGSTAGSADAQLENWSDWDTMRLFDATEAG